MKFAKEFRGVPTGEIYPVEYRKGEECPPELEAGATALGALETKPAGWYQASGARATATAARAVPQPRP